MASTFTWLDHSDRDRRRVLEVIDRFAESDTRDELGLGSIRDAFADLLFPGTSTLFTRARYLLFVPWIYLALETKRVSAEAIAARARRDEVRLRDALLASDDHEGTFGRLAGAGLKRMPSSIYWHALGVWKIRRFAGSQYDYHRAIEATYRRASAAVRDDDGDLVAGRLPRNWDARLPPAPREFPERASFRLRRVDAVFLRDQILFAAPRSLMANLARHADPTQADFAWMHPRVVDLPDYLRGPLEHARLFAGTMHGAALLYNLMLTEALPAGERRDERLAVFRGAIADWTSELSRRERAVDRWDRAGFWQLVRTHARVGTATERFVEAWLELRPWTSLAAAEGARPRALVHAREQQLKGGRARMGNPRALELWGGESGSARLNYRWTATQRILRDIFAGLDQEDTDARA